MTENGFGLDRFEALLDDLAGEAVRRDAERELPMAAVEELRDLGFGALRVPQQFGGGGCDLPTLLGLVVRLAAADSNVAHLYRGHFAYGEIVGLQAPSPRRTDWLRLMVDGALVGNASSESTGANLADISTSVRLEGDRWRLDGRKFYSTGTMFATHTFVSAVRENPSGDRERVMLIVPIDAAGVDCIDDWAGIGQRLTGSGTTVFDDVTVAADEIVAASGDAASHLPAFYQLYLVAVVAGIGAAIVRDTVDYLRPRTRNFITSNTELPRHDPQVLAVVGELSSDAFAAEALVTRAAVEMQRCLDLGSPTAAVDRAEVAAYQAQLRVLELVGRSATRLFEVGGASAVISGAGLDRHWRNVRTLTSHNPLIYKARQIGDYEVNNTSPSAEWRKLGVVPAPPPT